MGDGLDSLKFMAVDVEPCCGEFQSWQASHQYAVSAESESGDADTTTTTTLASITDPANQIQAVITPRLSSSSAPAWNDVGGLNVDGTVVWQDTGQTVIPLKERIKRIRAAVYAIQAYGKPAVIYTTKRSWRDIAGNCGGGSASALKCSSLMRLPLWDVEHGKLTCGDAVVGLSPFTPYTPNTWQSRSGNQFDYGLVPLIRCSGVQLFGITLDLDYLDPSLLQ